MIIRGRWFGPKPIVDVTTITGSRRARFLILVGVLLSTVLFAPDPAASSPPGTIVTVAGGGVGDGNAANNTTINQPWDVAADAAGNVYVADTTNSRVRKITAGVVSTVAGNGSYSFSGDGGAAPDAGLKSPEGVAVDGSGDVYIADTGNCRVREVIAGIISTVAGTGVCGFSGDGGPATSAKLSPLWGIAVDAAGNVYVGDQGNCRVRKVSAGIITTVAGNGTCGFSGDGGPATSAATRALGVAADAAGDIFIADSNDCRIREVNSSSGIITTVAGSGTCGYTGDGGSATIARLSNLEDVAVDATGNLYIADTINCVIRKVGGGTGIISTAAGNGACGYLGDGGVPTSAELLIPRGVGVDTSGNVYIADSQNCRVRKATGAIINTFAGNGSCGYFGDGGAATSAALALPVAVRTDAANNVFIADLNNCRVRKVNSGIITTVVGNGTCGYSGDGGPASSAMINNAYGLAVDGAANLYVADTLNCRVRRVSGGTITTVAGNGTCGFSGDGGLATSAKLNGPHGVVVDASGNLYVADNGNCRVRKVSGGIISTVAGNGSCTYSGDGGSATSAGVNPRTVAVDAASNLYIADLCRVREVSGGAISTVAGTGGCTYAGDGGPATSAGIDPYDVAVYGGGNLYIADSRNCRVRAVSGGVIRTLAGNGDCAYAGDAGAAGSAALNQPSGLAIDGAGNLYIADQYNNRVREVLTPDTDGDGMSDAYEAAHACLSAAVPDATADPDGDGLTNLEEMAQSTDPCNADSDGDGLNDGVEVHTYGTNPHVADTDGDGLPDSYEVMHPCLNATAADATADSDLDGLTNQDEMSLGTNPCNPDTDGDALSDGAEVGTYGTSPVMSDTDGDGCGDGKELGVSHVAGGQRDPLSPYDFFDVPSPALRVNAAGTRDHGIGVTTDVVALLAYSGVTSGAAVYIADYDNNGIPDGLQYDRTLSTTAGQPWRSGPPDGGIGVTTDVVAMLAQAGNTCT